MKMVRYYILHCYVIIDVCDAILFAEVSVHDDHMTDDLSHTLMNVSDNPSSADSPAEALRISGARFFVFRSFVPRC